MASETTIARESVANPINAQRAATSSRQDGRMELTQFRMSQRDLDDYGASNGYTVENGNYRATMVDTGMGKRG